MSPKGEQSTLRVSYTARVHADDEYAADLFLKATKHPARIKICRTSARSLIDLKEDKADIAIIPFIKPGVGYFSETLREMTDLFDVVASQLIKCRRSLDIVSYDGIGPNPNRDRDALPVLGTVFISQASAKLATGASDALKQLGTQVIETVSDEEALKRMRQSCTGHIEISDQLVTPVGAIVPSEHARSSRHFDILKADIGDRVAPASYFIAAQRAKDATHYFDKYRTTDAKTRYFCRRMKKILAENVSKSGSDHGNQSIGLNVLIQLSRSGKAAGIGEIESYLRNYGVRHHVFQYPMRGNDGEQEPVLLDLEFGEKDFYYDPRRRIRGTVANGGLKLAFSGWKKRNAIVVGAMPIREYRMAAETPRRWWNEGANAAVSSFKETMFIRYSRVLFYLVILLAIGLTLKQIIG